MKTEYEMKEEKEMKLEKVRKDTEVLLEDLRRVVEDLESKATQFTEVEEIEEFNEELELQVKIVETLI